MLPERAMNRKTRADFGDLEAKPLSRLALRADAGISGRCLHKTAESPSEPA